MRVRGRGRWGRRRGRLRGTGLLEQLASAQARADDDSTKHDQHHGNDEDDHKGHDVRRLPGCERSAERHPVSTGRPQLASRYSRAALRTGGPPIRSLTTFDAPPGCMVTP